MSRGTTRLLGWLLLAVYSATGVALGRGLVLCFEPDGHVALELAADCSGCCPADEAGSAASIGSCPCSDIPIGVAGSEQIRVGHFQLDAPPTLGWAVSTEPVRPARLRIRADDLPRSQASAMLASLRTVVLHV